MRSAWFSGLFACVCSHAAPIEIGDNPFEMQSLQTGRGQHAVAISDLNADEQPDLAITSSDDDEVTIFIGDGRGKLERAGTYSAGDNPSDVVAKDYDRDGRLDLVIANHETSYVTILRGNGDGTLHSPPISPLLINASPHPHAVAVEDLDNDGLPDVVVDHRDGQGLVMMRGVNGGRFDSRGTVIPVGGDPYLGFAIGDLNGDGRPDIVTPNADDIAIVYGSKQVARFTSPIHLPMSRPFAVALGDLNGDAHTDIVAASESADAGVQVFLGMPVGTPAKTPSTRLGMSAGAKRIAVGDINGDGRQDIAIANWSSELRVVFGGESLTETHEVPLGALRNPWNLAVRDLNGDGKGDLVVTDGTLPIAMLYLSQSSP